MPSFVVVALAAVAGLGLVALAVVGSVRRRRLIKRYGAAAVGRRQGFRWRRQVPVLLMVAGFGLLGLAFAQTRIDRQVTQGTVILTMDVSHSMDQADVAPNRLAAAQAAARVFLQRLPSGFDVGLVTFAAQPQVVVAPTSSRGDVDAALASVSTSRGTVIGDGLSSALDAIQSRWDHGGAGPAAVLLLSDGQDTGSRVAPDQAAARAGRLGVPVFTVTLGTPGEARAGGGGADTEVLHRMAEVTGGRAFTAQTSGELTQVYHDLGSTLSYDLAIGGSAWLLIVLAAVCAVTAGLLPLIPERRRF